MKAYCYLKDIQSKKVNKQDFSEYLSADWAFGRGG